MVSGLLRTDLARGGASGHAPDGGRPDRGPDGRCQGEGGLLLRCTGGLADAAPEPRSPDVPRRLAAARAPVLARGGASAPLPRRRGRRRAGAGGQPGGPAGAREAEGGERGLEAAVQVLQTAVGHGPREARAGADPGAAEEGAVGARRGVESGRGGGGGGSSCGKRHQGGGRGAEMGRESLIFDGGTLRSDSAAAAAAAAAGGGACTHGAARPCALAHARGGAAGGAGRDAGFGCADNSGHRAAPVGGASPGNGCGEAVALQHHARPEPSAAEELILQWASLRPERPLAHRRVLPSRARAHGGVAGARCGVAGARGGISEGVLPGRRRRVPRGAYRQLGHVADGPLPPRLRLLASLTRRAHKQEE
mmetsp:Transcript_5536/g.16406  ORF Transcript_5536/g.16406 Transcript_5536/m.16406 type:complete len:365 (+) Transcript_5536:276-1370(+)